MFVVVLKGWATGLEVVWTISSPQFGVDAYRKLNRTDGFGVDILPYGRDFVGFMLWDPIYYDASVPLNVWN